MRSPWSGSDPAPGRAPRSWRPQPPAAPGPPACSPGTRRSRRSRARWRRRRLTRLRVTAGPTALETTKPTRGPAGTDSMQCRRGRRPEVDDHQLTAAASAAAYDLTKMFRRGQAVAGGEHAWLLLRPQPQAARRLRPLRRRLDRIERPARVRMRRRKPWVLCRRRLFGWNVRLLNVFTPLEGLGTTVWSPGRRRARTPSPVEVNWHRSPMNDPEVRLSWTCGTGRRRCTDLPTVRGARGQGQFGADWAITGP